MGLSGRKIMTDRRDSGLSSPLQKVAAQKLSELGSRLVVEMGEGELDEFFDGLIRLVELEGPVQ